MIEGHSLFVGKTGNGKTTLAKDWARSFQANGVPVLVLSSMAGEWLDDSPGGFCADYATEDPAEFVQFCFEHTQCFVIIDEGGDVATNADKDVISLATRGRHWGHVCLFLGQCGTSVASKIRQNCSNFFIFKSNKDACKEIDKSAIDPMVYSAMTLDKGYCVAIIGNEPGFIMKATDWAKVKNTI